MGDEREDTMDLDLNLEPSFPPSPSPSVDETLRRIEEVALRSRHRWRRSRPSRIPPETRNISMDLVVNPPREIERLQTGEGSVAVVEERTIHRCKTRRGNAIDLIAKALGKDEDVGKEISSSSSFFDCNICFEMATDPVLTSCGHLFCWPCLYQWLHVHSDTKECPVCKGEVMDMNITPIYGRGNDAGKADKEDKADKEEQVTGLKVPPRPQARRIESLRQSIHRVASSSPVEEVIRRLGRRFDLTGELGTSHNLERASRGIRRGRLELFPHLAQNILGPQEDIVDLTQENAVSSEAEGSQRLPSSRLLLRSHSQRTSSLLSSVQAYFLGHPLRRNHTQSPPVEDRDSVSSIAAVVNSESQTVDTAMEIDSMVSVTSSSSRRRTDTSRVTDVDDGVPRAPRRRRLN